MGQSNLRMVVVVVVKSEDRLDCSGIPQVTDNPRGSSLDVSQSCVNTAYLGLYYWHYLRPYIMDIGRATGGLL